MRWVGSRKSLIAWLYKYCHFASFLLLLGAVVWWDHQVLQPPMLADLTGDWDTRVCAPDPTSDECESWLPARVPGHFLAHSQRSRPWQRVEFRKALKTPPVCLSQTCKLVFAEVGDTLDVMVNGVRLRQIQFGGRVPYEKNYALGVDLPPSVLAMGDQDNVITASVRSMKKDQTGLRAAPVAIMTQEVGQRFIHAKTFRSLYLPLISAVVACISALLLQVSCRPHLSSHLRLAFDRYALAAALFLVSFSEVPRQILPLDVAVPLHFFWRFAADGALLALLGRMLSPSRDLWVGKALYAGALAIFLILTGMGSFEVGHDVASTTYDLVRLLNPLCATGFLFLSVHAARNWHVYGTAFSLSIWAMIMHDYLVGSGYLQAEFVSKYHHAFIVFGLAILLARQAGRRQEIAHAQGEAERQLAEIARQVAHDIQSPVQALKFVSSLNPEIEGEPQGLMRDAIARIEGIVETMRTSVVRLPLVAEGSPVVLGPILAASLSEAQVKHRNMTVDWQVDIDGVSTQTVLLDVTALRRVMSNLLNNAVESLREDHDGCIRLAAHRTLAGQLRIVIADNGRGIPDVVLSNLGRRGLTVGKERGSGLGLSHAWEAVQSWNGRLTCRRLRQGGTEVTIDLPRAAAEQSDEPARRSA